MHEIHAEVHTRDVVEVRVCDSERGNDLDICELSLARKNKRTHFIARQGHRARARLSQGEKKKCERSQPGWRKIMTTRRNKSV